MSIAFFQLLDGGTTLFVKNVARAFDLQRTLKSATLFISADQVNTWQIEIGREYGSATCSVPSPIDGKIEIPVTGGGLLTVAVQLPYHFKGLKLTCLMTSCYATVYVIGEVLDDQRA